MVSHGLVAHRDDHPRGTAAVLINRAHTGHDVYLPTDAWEMRRFDAGIRR